MTPSDRALLDTYGRYAVEKRKGARQSALTAVSGLSPTRAYQRLLWLLTDPQAWEHAPMTMGLIQRRARRSQLTGARPSA